MTEKYDQIGLHYNRTRKADPYLADWFYQHLKPKKGGKYLDIGCGTGNYTIELKRKGVDFTGLDPSEKMLEKAKAKNRDIQWVKGNAEDLPFENECFDGAMATLTLHHWSDLKMAFGEIFRVLKPIGKLVIFTSTPQQMKGYWLNHYFPQMMNDSMVQMPSLERVGNSMTAAGFSINSIEKYFIREGHEDLFLYAGKQEPSLYLDEQVRQGISSFSALANQAEVGKGLKFLEQDIASGFIEHLIREFDNDEGDYLFIVAEKCSGQF